MDSNSLTPLLFLWVLIFVPLIAMALRRPSCGLVISYCFQMWMLYWLGALIHALPWAELPETDLVELGFQQATFGIAAFAAGVVLAAPALGKAILGKDIVQTLPDALQVEPEMDTSAARRFLKMGLISYFILAPTIGRLKGLNAVSAAAAQLVVAGSCLQAWMAWHRSGKAGLLRVLPATLLIPAVILVKQGFLSYGVLALSTIMLFVAQFFRPRWILAIGCVICGYMGLTVYVSYMRDRTDIRSVVWAGETATLSDKIQIALHTLTTLEAFDAKNPDHLTYIDGRLNQDGLVGAAVENLSGLGQFKNGSTIVDALMGMIPRLIWPSKPMSAGSGNLVSSLTGMEFVTGTSVGVGPVLEFYGNFGTKGVVIGMFLFGVLVGALDFCAGVHLRLGNWTLFTCFFLVGISCLNVSGSLVEVSMAAAASVAVGAVVRRIERRSARRLQPIEAAAG
jgi:hypothetical protein